MINRFLAVFGILCCLATQLASQTLPDAVTDDLYFPVDPQEALLGQLLFYDPILSGNKTVACATCHHPNFGTSDGVSLSIGDGGTGLGPARSIDPANPPEKRIPRNSPALFNLGARSFTVMFHDGRLEANPDFEGGVRSPLDADMMQGFASVLSAQTMFPVLSRDEMAGSYNENEIGRAVRQGLVTGEGGAWDLLSRRVADLPEYAEGFDELLEVKSFHFTNATVAAETAAEANRTADSFVLVTVIMASVLFFAGVGTKLKGQAMRITMLVVASLLCAVAIVGVLSLPHQPVSF